MTVTTPGGTDLRVRLKETSARAEEFSARAREAALREGRDGSQGPRDGTKRRGSGNRSPADDAEPSRIHSVPADDLHGKSRRGAGIPNVVAELPLVIGGGRDGRRNGPLHFALAAGRMVGGADASGLGRHPARDAESPHDDLSPVFAPEHVPPPHPGHRVRSGGRGDAGDTELRALQQRTRVGPSRGASHDAARPDRAGFSPKPRTRTRNDARGDVAAGAAEAALAALPLPVRRGAGPVLLARLRLVGEGHGARPLRRPSPRPSPPEPGRPFSWCGACL